MASPHPKPTAASQLMDDGVFAPATQPIHRLFELQAEQTPQALALLMPEVELSYAELNRRANQLAHALRASGVRPESIVGICMDRSAELLIAQLAVLKAGAAYLPLNPGHPPARRNLMLDAARAELVLTQLHLRADVSGWIRPLCLDDPAIQAELVRCPDHDPASAPAGETLSYVIFTSGSTGQPKGVMISQRAISNLVADLIVSHDHRPGDRMLVLPPASFDGSIGELCATLASGGTVVLHPNPSELSAEALAQFCERYQITGICTATALWQEWVLAFKRRFKHYGPDARLSSLRTLVVGGDVLRADTLQQWAQQTGQRVRVFNQYGPTETTVCATSYQAVDGSEQPGAGDQLPIGRPLDNVQVHLLDESGRPVVPGESGEIMIGGLGVARGYLNRPDLTAERFVPDPFSATPGARMYRSGDHGRWLPGGDLAFLGRADQQVKLRGFRVELAEIEAELLRHPAVLACVVLVREDRPGVQQLVAYVVPSEAESPASRQLRDFLSVRLPDYMLPTAYVSLPHLPLTPNNKLDLQALPAPASDSAQRSPAFRAPATAVEEQVARIWEELFSRPVSADANFFDLGGHSLLAIQLVSRLHETFEISLELADVFDEATISAIAARIESRLAGIGSAGPAAHSGAAVDLWAEVRLDPVIRPSAGVAGPNLAREPRHILLTGATGYLGSFLLRDLLAQTSATIVCLVRASSPSKAMERIKHSMARYNLWDDGMIARIEPLQGTLDQPRLGLDDAQWDSLAERIDVIYHNGALVNFVYPYSMLKAANVQGSEEILRLACQGRLKPVHYTSTLAIFLSSRNPHRRISEADPPEQTEGLPDGYSQSKWVADRLMLEARARGVPVAIYRPARVTGTSQGGVSNPDDIMSRFLLGSIELGIFPSVDDHFDMTPVDYLSQSIVYLSRRGEALGGNFHFFNPTTMRLAAIRGVLGEYGYELRDLPYAEWLSELRRAIKERQDSSLYPILHTFEQGTGWGRRPFMVCAATEAALAPSGLVCPPADRALLRQYLDFLLAGAPERGRG